MIVAFTGSRTFDDAVLVEKVMRRVVQRFSPDLRIRVGDARGLDLLVGSEATRWGIWPEQEVCHWPPAGATRQERWLAAHERNIRVVGGSMQNPGQADCLVAFFASGARSPGTTDCVSIARDRGLPIDIYHEGYWTHEGPP